MLFRLLLVCTIIGFAGFYYALQIGESENQSRYEKALLLMDEYTGDPSLLKKAHELLKEIEIDAPNSKYVFVGYARLLYKSGYINYQNYNKDSIEKSKAYIEKAILIDPNFFDAYFYGAYPYLFSKDFVRANQLANHAEKLAPNSAKVDVLHGEIAKKEGNYDAVIMNATAAIEKMPNNKVLIDAYYQLISAYKSKKEYDLVESMYQKVIEIEPSSPWVRVNYSSFLSDVRKNYDESIEQGEIALGLMDFGMGHKVLGKAYYAKAAQLHWKEKQYEESIRYYLLSIEHDPANSNAHYGLGMSYYIIGYNNKDKSQIIQAEMFLDKAVQINPDNNQAIEQLKNVKLLRRKLS